MDEKTCKGKVRRRVRGTRSPTGFFRGTLKRERDKTGPTRRPRRIRRDAFSEAYKGVPAGENSGRGVFNKQLISNVYFQGRYYH